MFLIIYSLTFLLYRTSHIQLFPLALAAVLAHVLTVVVGILLPPSAVSLQLILPLALRIFADLLPWNLWRECILTYLACSLFPHLPSRICVSALLITPCYPRTSGSGQAARQTLRRISNNIQGARRASAFAHARPVIVLFAALFAEEIVFCYRLAAALDADVRL